MQVPTSIARSLLAYVKSGGTEHVKAETMLNSMGWLTSGERAPQDVVESARLSWVTEQVTQQEIKI